jgi:hypothetical protein
MAECAMCGKEWVLAREQNPRECKFCKSRLWRFGPDNKAVLSIRRGVSTKDKVLNKGAKSKRRQDCAKKQWNRFKDKDGNSVWRKPS